MPITRFVLLISAACLVLMAAVWVFQTFGLLVFAAVMCATGLFTRWAMEPVRLKETKHQPRK